MKTNATPTARRTAALLSTLAVLALAAGCATESEASTAVAAPVASTGESTSAGLVLVDVRVGEHDGFDRVVLEFAGTGKPGWVVDYVDRAVQDGSGEVVDLGGDAVLDVYAGGTTWPDPAYYDGPTRLPGVGAIEEVYVAGTFEGDTQVLVGLDAKAPYRVFALTSPPRLVVDVTS